MSNDVSWKMRPTRNECEHSGEKTPQIRVFSPHFAGPFCVCCYKHLSKSRQDERGKGTGPWDVLNRAQRCAKTEVCGPSPAGARGLGWRRPDHDRNGRDGFPRKVWENEWRGSS